MSASAPVPPAASTAQRRQRMKQRPRATWACDRCRTKKLRCTGGQPCIACRRAVVECDFGDRGGDPHQNIAVIAQRLASLEQMVTEFIAGWSSLSHPRQPSPSPSVRVFPGPSDVESSSPLPLAEHVVTRPSLVGTRPSQGPGTAPEQIRPLSPNPTVSEGLDSRWEAIQSNPAPFPAFMAHPTVWSGRPATPRSLRNPTIEPPRGMTLYEARVHLQSEPVAEGILTELMARALLTLFFQKCHPLFPVLETPQNIETTFDGIRSSSPFLLTVIVAIAARYYSTYRETHPSLPPITTAALDALADLACAHLGFVLFRKEHQLSDVQATLLLSVWIPRGSGLSADQWMVTGLCTRLAYRIGLHEPLNHSAITSVLDSDRADPRDLEEAKRILPRWHTWLLMTQYDILLSLGFGRPHAVPFVHASPRQYLAIARMLGPEHVDLRAATYVTSLSELCGIAVDLVSGLRCTRSPRTQGEDMAQQPTATVWSKVMALLYDLNPRLEEWQRHWTWKGSYDYIELGNYATLVIIHGEHVRLCLNSLSLNIITMQTNDGTRPTYDAFSCLANACEAAVALVQYYLEPPNQDADPIPRYGGDYLILILGQAAVFFVRVLVARLQQPLPIDRSVLEHYLNKAIECLESNNAARSNICAWVGRLIRDLAGHACCPITAVGGGCHVDTSSGIEYPNTANPNITPNDAVTGPGLEWDFDLAAVLGQNIPAGETGLDLGHYFDFAHSFFPHPLQGQRGGDPT